MKTLTVLKLPAVLAGIFVVTFAFAVPDDGDRLSSPPGEPPTLEDIKQLIDRALPEDILADNSELLRNLLNPVIAKTDPSSVFNIKTAPRLLGMRRPRPTKGCFAPGPSFACVLSEGSRAGGGAYRQVEADSLGNISFINRLADPSRGKPEGAATVNLPSFTMSDKAAFDTFFDVFVNIFGMPTVEAPDVSEWALEELLLGMQDSADPAKPQEILPVAGMVRVPRRLAVDGLSVRTIPVLGSHVQGAIDDLGRGLPFRVEVQDWTRFTFPAAMESASPLARAELVDEIAKELVNALREKPMNVVVEIAYAKVGRFDELGSYGVADADDGTAAADGIPDAHRYVPVLLTSVSPLADDATEEEQGAAFSSAGQEFVTPLFKLSE